MLILTGLCNTQISTVCKSCWGSFHFLLLVSNPLSLTYLYRYTQLCTLDRQLLSRSGHPGAVFWRESADPQVKCIVGENALLGDSIILTLLSPNPTSCTVQHKPTVNKTLKYLWSWTRLYWDWWSSAGLQVLPVMELISPLWKVPVPTFYFINDYKIWLTFIQYISTELYTKISLCYFKSLFVSDFPTCTHTSDSHASSVSSVGNAAESPGCLTKNWVVKWSA